MKVRPKESYKVLSTEISVTAGTVYDAVPATNQPDYEKDGKIFITNAEGDSTVIGLLLVRGEYETVKGE